MRTLELTNEETSALMEALGIAEKTYIGLVKKSAELLNVRNNDAKDAHDVFQPLLNKSSVFSKLNDKIKRREADV
jgi:hypothetical protein